MPETEETLQAYLEAFNWADILQYGEVRVKVRNGKITLMVVEKQTKLD